MEIVSPKAQAALMRARHKAQGILEYVSLLAVVGAALLTMNLYFKMGIQAGIRGMADFIGGQKQGSREEDFTNIWFTNGVKGVKSVSETFGDQRGQLNTTLGKANAPHYVKYEENQASNSMGLAEWSVGIERERVGIVPGRDSAPGDTPTPGTGTGEGTEAGSGTGTGSPPPTVKTACPPASYRNLWLSIVLGWEWFWNLRKTDPAGFEKRVEGFFPWMNGEQYQWMFDNYAQGLYDWAFNDICNPPS